jgi:hypothetical protein
VIGEKSIIIREKTAINEKTIVGEKVAVSRKRATAESIILPKSEAAARPHPYVTASPSPM